MSQAAERIRGSAIRSIGRSRLGQEQREQPLRVRSDNESPPGSCIVIRFKIIILLAGSSNSVSDPLVGNVHAQGITRSNMQSTEKLHPAGRKFREKQAFVWDVF